MPQTNQNEPTHKQPNANVSDRIDQKPLAIWKIALFSTITTVVFLGIFIALLELCLAFAGVGVPTNFYVTSKHNDKEALLSNQHFMRQYFGSGISRGCLPFIIPKEKSENTVRIFLLGASAAQGDPEPTYGISRQMETMLKQQYPDQHIEVYNVAITAINSHVVLPIMRACADIDPDLFIIYLGNNEVVGPYGSGSVFSSALNYRWLIALQTQLKGSRVGQWVSEHFQAGNNQQEEWKGMEMFLDNAIAQEDPRMQTVYKHYRNNLRSMFKIGNKHDVPVIISSVAVNLKDNAPFGSEHKPGMSESTRQAWKDLYTKGIEQQKQKQYDQALESYTEALEFDDQYADLSFKIAECYLKTGNVELAKKAYERTRDLDTFRFRADSTINNIIKDTASEFKGVTFIDGRAAVEAHSQDGIPGTELFYEHVHFNFSGNYLMAKTLTPAVARELENKRGMIPQSHEIIPESEVKKRLAYTRWNQLKIARSNAERLEEPPFTFQSDIDIQQAKLEKEINTLTSTLSNQALEGVLTTYEHALKESPNWFLHNNLADFHLKLTGNLPMAEKYYQKMVDEFPHYTTTFDILAKVKLLLGHYTEAEELLRKSLAATPSNVQRKTNLGVALGYQERYDEAIPLLREAVAADVYVESAYFNLAVYLFNQDKNDTIKQNEAYKYWKIVLEKNPDHLEARYGIANICLRQGRTSEAIQELEFILIKNPGHQRSRQMLDQLH